MTIQVVILAAGQGRRMQSHRPKVLHPLAGKPLLAHVLQTATKITEATPPIVVYGHQGEQLRAQFADQPITWVEQKEQLGTGHALKQTLSHLNEEAAALILYGDVPLISATTLTKLINAHQPNSLALLTATLPNPRGYGRIKRDAQQKICSIVEEKDATEEERRITEINPGIYFIPVPFLKKWLPKLSNQNKQGEFYLTDVISFAVQEEIPIHTIQPEFYEEILGVNDCMQLAALERFYQWQVAKKLMQAGVFLRDPARFDVRGNVTVGVDVSIDINVILAGENHLGDHCQIGANCRLQNVRLGKNVIIKDHCVIEDATIEDDCIIGPFARVRPGTQLGTAVHIGNFVEIKNSALGTASKVNHLSYIGDSDIGKNVNIGAGTITCNYDGANKYKTIIGDDVHIGSDTQLVAPVTVGDGATIGAGSTITKDVPSQKLTVTHALKQRVLPGWVRPNKEKMK